MDRRFVLQAIVAAAFARPAFAHDMGSMGAAAAILPPEQIKITHFAAPRHAALETLVDLIIPKTDTPGAGEAGVGSFIELMYEHWMIDAERRRADLELDRVVEAFAKKGDPSVSLYERGTFTAPMLRKLTIYGYYTSEAGSSEELDLNLVPGSYEACAPVTSDTRAPSLNAWGIGLDLTPGRPV